MKDVTESMAGRAAIFQLLPFSLYVVGDVEKHPQTSAVCPGVRLIPPGQLLEIV